MSVNGPMALTEADGVVTWSNMADADVELHPPAPGLACKVSGCPNERLPGSGIYAALCPEHKATKQAARKAPAPLGTGAAVEPARPPSTPEPTTLDKLISELEQQAALYTRQIEIARRMREDLSPAGERGS